MAQRRSLLQSLLALAGLGAPKTLPVPDAALPAVAMPGRAALPLGSLSVAGGQYHRLAEVAHGLVPGQQLRLLREPANAHDHRAIAILTEAGARLGYIPRAENKQLAAMMDGGAEIVARLAEGCPAGTEPQSWRPRLHLELAKVAPPAPPSPAAARQVDALLRAAPIMAELRRGGPGPSALMLSGPAAGWRRGPKTEWLPPDPSAWPSMERLIDAYDIWGGHYASSETRRAFEAAAQLGLPAPGLGLPAPGLGLPPAEMEAQPPPAPKPPRMLLRGTLAVRDLSPDAVAGSDRFGRLGLYRRPVDASARHPVLVIDRYANPVAPLPRMAGQIIASLMDAGEALAVLPEPPGPTRMDGERWRLPFRIDRSER